MLSLFYFVQIITGLENLIESQEERKRVTYFYIKNICNKKEVSKNCSKASFKT